MLQRWRLVAAQAYRQLVRHWRPDHFYFSRIDTPRVLGGEYQPDFDAVHLVSARETANFFRLIGGRILFERKRFPRPAESWRDVVRNLFLRLDVGAYAGLNLQIVVEKR